jgi:glutaredoxin
MPDQVNPIIEKIIDAEPDTFIIFFVDECPYCQKALWLLRKNEVKYKGYNIHDIEGGMPALLKVLNDNADLIGFRESHRTKPIVFLNKTLIGGSDNLAKYFENKQ